jgi:hypothetical protein
MKYLTLIFLLLPLRLLAVNGDILGAEIADNGRDVFLYISGLNTNGTYAYGLGTTNNTITAATKLRLDVTRPGFDCEGNITSIVEQVWGTYRVRKAYPDYGSADEVYDSTNHILRTRIVMTRHIYTNDTVTMTLQSGFYTENGSNTLATSALVVTNSTLATYRSIIPGWTQPGWKRITNSTMTLSAVAFHNSGREGRPVRMGQFIVTDEHGVSLTNTCIKWQVRRDLGEYIQVGEMVSTFDITGFTDHDQLRCDFVMYPWFGDTNTIYDTRRNLYSGIQPYPQSQTNFLDFANTWGTGIAVVDPTIGTNTLSSGITNYLTSPAAIPTSYYFATISQAADMMSRYNQTNAGHADVGGGTIYCTSNVFNFAGGTFHSNTVPKTYLTLKPFPGHSWSLTNDTGSGDVGARVKIEDCTIAYTGSQIPFGTTLEVLWLERCVLNSTATGPIQATKIWLMDSIVNTFSQGLISVGSTLTHWNMRNNNIDGFNGTLRPYITIGNYHLTTNNGSISVVDSASSQSALGPDYHIFYDNIIMGGMTSGGILGGLGNNKAINIGCVWAQNVFEQDWSGSAASYTWGGTATASGVPLTNVMCFNNTLVGQRCLTGYNDSSTNAPMRRFWCLMGNSFDLNGFKSDEFGPSFSSLRTNNWDVMYNVNFRGNMYMENGGGPGDPSFPPYFAGINSQHPSMWITNTLSQSNQWPYLKFIRRATVENPATNSPGSGDYRLHMDAPGQSLPAAYILPIDLDGRPRGIFDPVGGYIGGSTKRTTFF